MGAKHARPLEQEDEDENDPILSIELENDTPIVGIELKPTIYMKYVHGCVFRWERLPTIDQIRNTKVSVEDPRKPKLLSICGTYIPTNDDIGHRLRFSCTLLTSTRGITKLVVTEPAIPMPQAPADRTWTVVTTSAPKTAPPANATSLFSSFASSKLDTSFIVLSYNMMSTPTEQSRTLYPNCPSYALSKLYRKKILLRELMSTKVDIMCLQQVEESCQEYWFVELSKAGYSGFNDFGEKSNSLNKTAILYRRSKFNKEKDIILRFQQEYERVMEANDLVLKKLVPFSLVNQIVMGEQVAIVSVLELKDVYMARDTMEGTDPSYGKVIVVNTQLYKVLTNPLNNLIQLIQAYLLVQKVQQVSMNGKIPVVFAGDFGNNCDSILYKYLCNGAIKFSPTDLASTVSSSEQFELQNVFSLKSAYSVAYQQEPSYTLSDQGKTDKKIEDFIFFSSTDFVLRRVAQLPSGKSYPNADYISDHVALLAELEFVTP